MDLKFVEAGNGFNWGKFAVGRFTLDEMCEPATVDGMAGAPLIASQGWAPHHVWVLDLATGEGAMFDLMGLASADLQKHKIWVCPLYEPFLTWLYAHRRELGGDWWIELPRSVELPHAPAEMYGYRRDGSG
jgi:hypothetical protein